MGVHMLHIDIPVLTPAKTRSRNLALTLALVVALTGCAAGTDSGDSGAAPEQQSVEQPAPEQPADDAPVEEAPAAPAGDTVSPDAIVGMWAASDGSGIKIIDYGGACSGMYYNQGSPLDIGGPMSCALGSEQRSDGSYLLVVTQAPNQATYPVLFDGNTFTLYSGDQSITMTRQ